MNKRNIKTTLRNVKTVAIDFPKEILKRTASQAYAHKKIFGSGFGKKKR